MIVTLDTIQPIATTIAQSLTRGDVITLDGDLGTGKTTWVQSIAHALNCTDSVTSPSYALVNQYQSSIGSIYHLDLYRLDTIEALYSIDIDYYLCPPDGISLIEWGCRLQSLKPSHCRELRLQYGNKDSERVIDIHPSL